MWVNMFLLLCKDIQMIITAEIEHKKMMDFITYE